MLRLRPPARPGRRSRRLALAGAATAALLVSTALVWRTAWATFTVTTPTYATTWSTGTVAITDDDAGSALFTVTGLAPGAAGTRCLTVTSTGSVPAVVRLYVSARSTTRSLTGAITVAVVSGTGATPGNCAGFVPDTTVYRGTLAAFPSTYGTGVVPWTTAGNAAGETRSYQLTYSVPSTASTASQGGTASATFTWEAQNA